MTAGEQTREPARQERWGRGRGAWPAWDTHPRGRGGFRALRRGVVGAGLRRGRTARDAGEADAADDGTAHRSAKPADEARTNPLVGLGRKGGGEERGWHWRECNRRIILFQGRLARQNDSFLWDARRPRMGCLGRGCRKVCPGAPAIALALATTKPPRSRGDQRSE